ncbi:MAG: DUF3107 domain-containing protein [Candidatus Phosphoribacter sp.]|nr:DUF3107 domain-containing protein [Actinomycetales bacterium]
MEVRIGVREVAREISFESDQTGVQVAAAVADALRDGKVLDLTDDKGRHYLVPAAAIGFVHYGESEKGRVGFGAQ